MGTRRRRLFESVPVHLIAGARSRDGWHVPGWALENAASYTEIAGAGHLVMLEVPTTLGVVLRGLLVNAEPPDSDA